MCEEKSHNVPFAGWSPRTARGVTQSESKGLRTRGAGGINPSRGAAKRRQDGPAHREAGTKGKSYSFTFCSLHSLKGLGDAPRPWGGSSAFQVRCSDAHLTWKHPHRHTRQRSSVWGSWLVTLTPDLTITPSVPHIDFLDLACAAPVARSSWPTVSSWKIPSVPRWPPGVLLP